VPSASRPDLSLFLDILIKLETLGIPYVIIGGFAATMYGITRVTYDIDILVDMGEAHIQALANTYPLPRYYADPHQMRRAIEIGSSFNIIDVERGEKADLIPLSMDRRNAPAFENRIRKTVDLVGIEPFSVWVARSEDVIVGKLMAWQEGRSERHTADIFEMLLSYYLGGQGTEPALDNTYVGSRASELGEEVVALWELLVETAQEQAARYRATD
jgi:hypothetical protein